MRQQSIVQEVLSQHPTSPADLTDGMQFFRSDQFSSLDDQCTDALGGQFLLERLDNPLILKGKRNVPPPFK